MGGCLVSVPLKGDSFFPESITQDVATGVIYVSGNGDGSIQKISRNGKAALFIAAGSDGRTEALGLKVNAQEHSLWVLDRESAYIYDLGTTKLKFKIEIKNALSFQKSFLNDLVFDDAGNAYITDSVNPVLIKVDAKSRIPSRFRTLESIPYGKQNNIEINLNGIVLSLDKKSVFAVKTNDGTLWQIGITDETVEQIKISEALYRGDGLTWLPNGDLIVARNFDNCISRVKWTKNSDIGTVSTFTSPELHIPTAALFVSGRRPKLLVVNSQFNTETPVLPFDLAGFLLPFF